MYRRITALICSGLNKFVNHTDLRQSTNTTVRLSCFGLLVLNPIAWTKLQIGQSDPIKCTVNVNVDVISGVCAMGLPASTHPYTQRSMDGYKSHKMWGLGL